MNAKSLLAAKRGAKRQDRDEVATKASVKNVLVIDVGGTSVKILAPGQSERRSFSFQQLPMMPAKAYRWVAEMREIAGFVGDDPAAHELYEGAAHFYERIAEDFSADQKAVAALKKFLAKA